MKRLWLK